MIPFKSQKKISQLCDLRFRLKEKEASHTLFINEDMPGEVIIRPKEMLHIESAGYKLILETKGRAKKYSEILQSRELFSHIRLEASRTYTYPLNLANSRAESYEGRNTQFTIRLEFYLKLAQKEDETPNLLTTLNKLIPQSGIYKKSIDLNYTHRTNWYQISSKEDQLVADTSKLLVILIIAAFLLIFACTGANLISIPWAVGIGVGIGIVVLGYLLWLNHLGRILFKFLPISAKAFEVQLKHAYNWQGIKEIRVGYEIREEIRENKSDNEETHTEVIYKSRKPRMVHPKGMLKVKQFFPQDALGTTVLGKSRIYWVMVVNVKTALGIPVKYEREFGVRKE